MDKKTSNCDNTPEPWLIDEIERLKEEQRQREDAQRPRLYIEPPPLYDPPSEPEEEELGGTVIHIDLCPQPSSNHWTLTPPSTSM